MSAASPQSAQAQQDNLARSILRLQSVDTMQSLSVLQAKLHAFKAARVAAFEPSHANSDFEGPPAASLMLRASNSCPGAKQDILARIAAIEALLKNGLGALPITAAGSLDLTALAAHCSTESQTIFARRQRLKEAALSIQSILKQ
jgi:hypothetical protein